MICLTNFTESDFVIELSKLAVLIKDYLNRFRNVCF